MNTGGLNGQLGTNPGSVGDMAAHLAAEIRHSPRRPVLARESASEGSDGCFVSQEKLKPQYLTEIPGKMKLTRVSGGGGLGLQGDKVRDGFRGGRAVIFLRFRVWCAFMLCLSAAHLCGFPGL